MHRELSAQFDEGGGVFNIDDLLVGSQPDTVLALDEFDEEWLDLLDHIDRL